MRTTHRIATALALALLGLASTTPSARAQALIGGNGLQNGLAINGLNNGFGGFNNGLGGGFNNGNAVAFGFGGPMNGGMAMFYGPGMGFGGNFGGQPGFGGNPMGGMMRPPAVAVNNLGGVAAAIDQQVVRRPGGPLPAVRRRRR